MSVVKFSGLGRDLTNQRMFDLIDRARHGRLQVATDITIEYVHVIDAISRHQRYEIAHHHQRLMVLLKQYDTHLRKTRARVRHYDLPAYQPGERRPTSALDALLAE
jgi:hypothetical protein